MSILDGSAPVPRPPSKERSYLIPSLMVPVHEVLPTPGPEADVDQEDPGGVPQGDRDSSPRPMMLSRPPISSAPPFLVHS